MLIYKYFLLSVRHSKTVRENRCNFAEQTRDDTDAVKFLFCGAIHGDYLSSGQKEGAGTILQTAQPLEFSSVGARE